MAPRDGALIAGITRFVETPADIKEACDDYVKMGANQIKLSMSGEEYVPTLISPSCVTNSDMYLLPPRITETLRAEDSTFPDDLVAAGVEAAHANGMRVCSHARADDSIVQCLQYGVDVIYHASFISESSMAMLEVQKDRVYVAPAINWLVGTLYDAEAFGCKGIALGQDSAR